MDPKLKAAHRYCARLTRREAKNFYFAFITLPKRKRLAIYAVYAFCREADDIADSELPLAEKAADLDRLRERLEAAAAGEPLMQADLALSDTIARFSVDPGDLADVLNGVEMDLTVSRYESFQELRRYCYLVAAAVGLSVLPILAHCRRGGAVCTAARDRAVALGLGMQLANIVRDVTEDIERDRVYLPKEDLKRFGVCEEDLQAGRLSGRMRALLAFEVERARDYLREGEKLLPYLPRRARGCPALLSGIYSRILERIEERDYDVFSSRIFLPSAEKLSLTLRTFGRAVLR